MSKPTNQLEEELDTYLNNSSWGVTLFAGHRDVLVRELVKFIEAYATQRAIEELKRLPIDVHAQHASHRDFCVPIRTVRSRIKELKSLTEVLHNNSDELHNNSGQDNETVT